MSDSKNNKLDETFKNENDNLIEQFETVVNNLNAFKSQITSIQQQIKNIEKNVKKRLKTLKNEKNKNKGLRKPSGFANPTKVTNELCQFMNKENGSELARTEVTRALVSYIKENNLENKQNSKIILPDNKLQNLLGTNDDQEVTYFNIQKFMNKHFIKSLPSNAI